MNMRDIVNDEFHKRLSRLTTKQICILGLAELPERHMMRKLIAAQIMREKVSKLPDETAKIAEIAEELNQLIDIVLF